MKREPLVSIITPTYNHERFIEQCIESVLTQTFPDWEMIVVDDCSTDRTHDIVSRYLGDRRIKYIRHKKNYGKEKLSLTHNECLAICKGDFITVLEGDDYWPNYRLQVQMDTFPDSAVLSHGFIGLDKEGHITIWKYPKQLYSRAILKNDPMGSSLKVFLTGRYFLFPQSVMVRRKILEKIGGFKQDPFLFLVDYPTFMEISLWGKFVFVPKVMGYWRRHPTSITANFNEDLWLGSGRYAEWFARSFRKVTEDLPVDLKPYLDNPGSYAYGILCKMKIAQGDREKAKKFFDQTWEKKASLTLPEKIKILLLFTFFRNFFGRIFYQTYLRLRTIKISPPALNKNE